MNREKQHLERLASSMFSINCMLSTRMKDPSPDVSAIKLFSINRI